MEKKKNDIMKMKSKELNKLKKLINKRLNNITNISTN